MQQTIGASETAAHALASRPLAGIRVVDFTSYASGPYCTLMLALLGAEVIRIESRTRLDLNRRPHPLYGRLTVSNFDHLSGHKKSVTLNLKEASARAIAKSLIGLSDVVIENYRPGVMRRFGLDWPAIHAVTPSVVMVSISAYGQDGPDSTRPGYAPVFAAEGGLSSVLGYKDGPPVELRNPMDHQVGLTSAFVALALLEERDRTGVGSHGDVSACEVATMLVGESVIEAVATGHSERIGNDHELFCPHGVYPTKGEDTWIAIVVGSDEEWSQLVAVLDSETLGLPAFSRMEQRLRRCEKIDAQLAVATCQWDGRELAKVLQANGVCAEISMSARDIIEDEHLWVRGSLVRLEHHEHGERATVQAPWQFAGASVGYTEWSPELGADNDEIICGLLGYDRAELDRWVHERVVF